jgi:two-component system, cell cycle response regulator DivK
MSPATAFGPTVASAPPRVLIVDDAQDDREMYALFLTAVGGCTVMEAANGREALDMIAQQQQQQQQPDVIVLDMMLPDVDGAEVCRRIRNSPAFEKTSVVTVTALPLQSAEVDRMINAGTDALLIKPCAPETLLAEIRTLLKQSRALRLQGQNARDRAAALRARSEQLQRRNFEHHRTARELLRTAEHLTLTQRVRAHYNDLPGLSLTSRQATRLFGFDETVCQRVLDTLSSEGYLIEAEGQYRRRAM